MSFKEYNMDLIGSFRLTKAPKNKLKGILQYILQQKTVMLQVRQEKNLRIGIGRALICHMIILLLLILTQIVAEYTDIESAIMLGTGKVLY